MAARGTVLLLLLLLPLLAVAAGARQYGGPPYPPPTFDCAALPEPPPAAHVRALRPGNIRAVMALGDSISAGFAMRGVPPADFLEYREDVFDIGGASGAITLPNLLRHYTSKLYGAATHVTIPLTKGSDLNAAVSMARVEDLNAQVQYLIDELPKYKELDVANDWKMLTVLIGANNACPACHNSSHSNPDRFEADLLAALQLVQAKIPRVFVNVMTMFNISQVWTIAHGDAYCAFVESHVSECGCLVDDAASRTAMDLAVREFNVRIARVAAQLNAPASPDFYVSVQPGVQDLAFTQFHDAREYLSHLDCFHPSVYANQAFAVALWNNLWAAPGHKATTISPENWKFTCPTADSFIQ